MMLTGRRLATQDSFSIWEEQTGETIIVQDSTRQLLLTLSVEEARSLRDALVAGLDALEQPELRKDAIRRFQILRARLTTLADQARQLPGDDENET